jgi:hypothetical protein
VNPPDFHRDYFVAWRSDDFLELLRKPNAFRLLALIAYRARWRDGYSADGVGPGECLLGADDVARVLKLSPRAYRTSKTVLEKGGFATFSGTGLGTVARIVNSRVFSTSVPENDRHNDRAEAEAEAERGERQPLPIEFPKGFPATEADAAKHSPSSRNSGR